jgi:hypothetical protein
MIMARILRRQLPSLSPVRRRGKMRIDRGNASFGRSSHGKPGGAKRRNVRLEPGLVTPKLRFQPRCDGEIPASREQTPCRILRLLGLTILVMGDHKVGEAEAGAAGVIGFEGGNRFLNLP